MKLILILISFVIIISLVLLLFFHLSDISRYAWGYRIRRITYKNGEKRYFIQQRIPFIMIWMNCSYMIGLETYSSRSYETKDEAKDFIRNFYQRMEEERGYEIKSKETIK